MTDKRPTISVESLYSYEINRIVLSEKGALPHQNRFFIQLAQIRDAGIRLQIRVEDGEYTEIIIPKKDFTLLQDNLREVLTNAGVAKLFNMAGNEIQVLHFEDGEIGFGIGKEKYLLEKEEAELLKEFCVRVI